jgi:hypothetical protein
VYLNQGLGFSPHRAGRLFAGMLAASAPVGILLSHASQRMLTRGVPSHIARGKFVCICLASGGLLFALVPFFFAAPLIKAMLIALGISTTPIIYSIGPAMVSQIVTPAQRGGAIAIEYSVAWTAGIVAPPAVGWLIRVSGNNVCAGFEHSLIAVGLLLLVLGIGSLRILNPERSIERLTAATA